MAAAWVTQHMNMNSVLTPLNPPPQVSIAEAAAKVAAELSIGGDLELSVWRHHQRDAKTSLQSRMALDPQPLAFAAGLSPRSSLARDDMVTHAHMHIYTPLRTCTHMHAHTHLHTYTHLHT